MLPLTTFPSPSRHPRIWLLLLVSVGTATSFQTVDRTYTTSRLHTLKPLRGWLDNFLPRPNPSASDDARRLQYPEQYPATYELGGVTVPQDANVPGAAKVRPLLKDTQLESRPLRLAYDASLSGFSAVAFHRAVDGTGAALVLCETECGVMCGGYNPKGWAGLGGARPSVASFLFHDGGGGGAFRKLRKVGGGGMACARDEPDWGISFGADGLVVPLGAEEGGRMAYSKLGPYFERGPEELGGLFGGETMLKGLKVFVGVYGPEDEIPYSGGVLDMTSG